MAKHFMALALLVILSSASAGFSARFSPDSSAFALSVDHLEYSGHYGNYSVALQVFPLPSEIRVFGQEASPQALSQEIAWLQENRALETKCNATVLLVLSYSDYYCAPDGGWKDCGQSAECMVTPVAPAAPSPADTQSTAYDGAGAMGEAARSLSQPAAAPMTQKNAAPQDNAAEAGIRTEQLLPLLGAFIAVIILSYLMLQQRQLMVEIGPQEAKLLENPTRAGIMQELSVADKIPTDLSTRLGKSKATVVEHLAALSEAGFVEKVETPGKKFVFYRLTRKGRVALLRKAA